MVLAIALLGGGILIVLASGGVMYLVTRPTR
jgi:hypothetical protein